MTLVFESSRRVHIREGLGTGLVDLWFFLFGFFSPWL